MTASRHFLPTAGIVEFVKAELAALVKARAQGGQKTLVLTCAGRTPKAIYEGLGKGVLTPEEWATVHFGLTDEFASTAERPNTNAMDLESMFFKQAVDTGLIPRTNLHWFDPTTDWDRSVPEYERELLSITGSFNVILLGAGGGPFWPGCAVDPGHVAAIMPGHPELWVDDGPRFMVVNDSPKPPRRRLTVTKLGVQEADLAFCAVTGTEKAGSVAHYLAESIDPVHAPLKVIDKVKGKAYFLTNVAISEIKA